MKSSDVVCRGCFVLGTACCACRRCVIEIASVMLKLTDDTPCFYDQSGRCTSHLLQQQCPHHTAKEMRRVIRLKIQKETGVLPNKDLQ